LADGRVASMPAQIQNDFDERKQNSMSAVMLLKKFVLFHLGDYPY
jgi:hypothetical protein